jgi:hypothetical protein
VAPSVGESTVNTDPTRERCLAEPPADTPMYAENFLLAAYDAATDVGAWLHLGTWPEDFGLWEDIVLLSLPDGDVLSMTGYRRTPVDERPAGSLLSFRCVEPFQRWRVEFDGLAARTPRRDLALGLVRDTGRERVTFALDVRCVTPLWDAASTTGRGSMHEQVWASDHYQQLLRIDGELTAGGQTYPISTTGVRDHSRGQRGHAMDQWGGHTLIHLLFPSGRAIGAQRMYSRDGAPNFDMAYTLIDGVWRNADIIEVPRLSSLEDKQARAMTFEVRTEDATHRLEGEIATSWFMTPQRLGLAVGADLAGPYGVFSTGHGRWTWDGEETVGLTERSFGAPLANGDPR